MSRITQLQTAIIATLKAGLNGFAKEVEAHHAPLDNAREVKRFSSRSPAVVVPVPRFLEVENHSGTTLARAQCSVFIVAKNKGKEGRDLIAATVAEKALQQIPEQRWGINTYSTPESLSGRSLYSTELDELGVALWGIAWTQIIELEPLVDYSNLDDFLTAHGDHYGTEGTYTDDQGTEVPLASDTISLPQE